MRIAAIADLHCGKFSEEDIRMVLEDVADKADVLLMGGDLTNVGLVSEIKILMKVLETIPIPKIAVLGNHDHENNEVVTLARIMGENDVCVLDCSSCIIDGVGFVGTKGFCGGFEKMRIQPFGENAIKEFVETSINETHRLEAAFKEVQTEKRVAILHYSPIKGTLAGESPELFPFLGSSLLANAMERHGVTVVFHGHAHHGTPEGFTRKGIPVHNVCRFVQHRFYNRHYMIYEI